MKNILYTSSIFIYIFFSYQAQGQIHVARSFQINPLEAEKERGWFGGTHFGAEAARGFGSTEEEQAWNIKYQGFIEFYRWGSDAVIGLNLAHELHANPFNEIRFNPRGAFWNESLVYQRQLRKLMLSLGVEHRCRHNIDNADPPRRGIPRQNFQPQGRVLVLTSLYAGLVSKGYEFTPQLKAFGFGRTDFYLYKEDARLPANLQEGSWEDFISTFSAGFKINWELSENLMVYSRNYAEYILVKDRGNPFNYRLEIGGGHRGKSALSLFFAHEYFFDDASNPNPQSSSVWYLGLRGNANPFF